MNQIKTPLFDFVKRHFYLLALIAILVLAVCYRFWQLNHLPPGLHPDEAANGLDVFRILEKHDFRPLYNTNGPREALFFYLQAISVAIFGNTILALRLVPAFIGSLGVFTTYLWANSWFGKRVALFAAFFMAVLPWSVTLSRDGFRASMVPLFLTLTLWLYTLAWRRRQNLWFILAGVSLGAGLYTYISYRAFPIALLVSAAALYLSKKWRQEFKRRSSKIILSVLAALIVFTPMLIFALHDPIDVIGARGSTSFLNHDINHGHPIQTLATNVGKTALMFNFHGDENFRHNLGGQPELNFFVGIMFIWGIVLSLVRWRKPQYAMLLLLFAALLAPEAVTAEGIPHALRSIGVIPFAVAFAGVGANYLLDAWYGTFPTNSAARTLGLSLVGLLLLLTAVQGWRQYFVAWANSPQTYEAYSEDATAIAGYLNKQTASIPKYVAIDGYSDKTVEYLTHHKSTYQRLERQDLTNFNPSTKSFILVLSLANRDQIVKLKQKFPQSHLSAYYSPFNDRQLFEIVQGK